MNEPKPDWTTPPWWLRTYTSIEEKARAVELDESEEMALRWCAAGRPKPVAEDDYPFLFTMRHLGTYGLINTTIGYLAPETGEDVTPLGRRWLETHPECDR
jgi:hypothetical protein